MAGHPPFLWLTNGEVRVMNVASGPPLGILPTEYPSTEISLKKGDRILFLTDGVFEAKNKEGKRIGFEKLVSFIKEHMGEDNLIQKVVDYVNDFSKGLARADDLTIVELSWDAGLEMKDLVVIKVQSDPKYLSVIRTVTAKMGELYGLSESAIEDVKLAVDEACSNVIKHAYGGDTHQSILVRYRMTKKGFEVLIEDNGVKVQPESIEGRNLDDIRPGGLGCPSHQKGIRYLPI